MRPTLSVDRRNREMTFYFPLFFIILLSCLSGASPAYPEARPQDFLKNKKVLVLNAFESNIPAFKKTDHGLALALQSGGIPIRNQFHEHLNLRRNLSSEHRKRMVELLRQGYERKKIDLIITLYPDALDFILSECPTIFPDVPILALYLPQNFKLQKTDRKIVQHLVIPDFKPTIGMALKLVPDLKRVYVVSGTHLLDKWLENVFRKDSKSWKDRLEFRYLTDLPLEEILTTAADAPSKSILFITAYTRDIKGAYHIVVDVSRMLASVSSVPIFGFLDILLGNGIVGGSLLSLESVGTEAGELALRMLSETPYSEKIPAVIEVPQLPMFDWHELRHWHLSESELPKGSIVINREFSLWDLKYYAMGILAFIMAQSFLIAGLLWHRRRRKSVEEALKTQLQFETLLFEMSTGFIDLPAEQIDSAIQDAQKHVCEILDLDLSALWQVSVEHPDSIYLTHLFRQLEGPRLPDRMEGQGYFPWCLQQITAGKVVAVSTEETPPEAARDQEMWRQYGIKSNLVFPLSVGGGLLMGALSFHSMREERDWPEQMANQLQLLAQVFANAIARKHADHALRESETRLTLATTAAGAGLWVIDLETEEVWVSEKTRELFHFLADEQLTYDSFFERVHPDDHEGVRRAVQETLQTGKELKCDYRIILPNADIRWIVSSGRRHSDANPTRLMGTSVDITGRKQMEESIRNAAEEWQATFDSIPHGVMVLDRDLKILRHNAAAASLFKLPSSEIHGQFCHHLMHGKSGPPVGCPVKRSLKMKNHQETELYDAQRKAWYQVSSDPILNEEGKITRVVHGIKDITERVEMEEKARRQWVELAHVTRIGVMGELTSSLAHEINQPLTAIQSNAAAARRFLSASEPDIAEVRQILDDIISDNKRAGGIIMKIRALLKKEQVSFEITDVKDLIADVLSLLRADTLLPELVITSEFSMGLPRISGDRIQLQQVIINLILNGTGAMKDLPPSRRKLNIKTAIEKDGNVKVSVTDFGTGIEEDAMRHIFEPFYTTKQEGMGMGLSISRTIIEAHGGTMMASNNPEGGATFSFTLPAHRGGTS
jgi:PAS domain S-box-containing protein